jgi:hypothetical protein
MEVLEQLFPNFVRDTPIVAKTLHVQQFIEFIRAKDIIAAIEYSQKFLTAYQKDNIYTLDSQGRIQEVPIDVRITLKLL